MMIDNSRFERLFGTVKKSANSVTAKSFKSKISENNTPIHFTLFTHKLSKRSIIMWYRKWTNEIRLCKISIIFAILCTMLELLYSIPFGWYTNVISDPQQLCPTGSQILIYIFLGFYVFIAMPTMIWKMRKSK